MIFFDCLSAMSLRKCECTNLTSLDTSPSGMGTASLLALAVFKRATASALSASIQRSKSSVHDLKQSALGWNLSG